MATCCFCQRSIEREDFDTAVCWIDPHGAAVAGHLDCVLWANGMPEWPILVKWLKENG